MKVKNLTVIKDTESPPDDYDKLFNNMSKKDFKIANENVNKLDIGTLVMGPYGSRYYSAVITRITETAVFFTSILGHWKGKAKASEVFNIRLLPMNSMVEAITEYDNFSCLGSRKVIKTSLYELNFAQDDLDGTLSIMCPKTKKNSKIHWGYLSINLTLANSIRRWRKCDVLKERWEEYDDGIYYTPLPRQAAYRARRRLQMKFY